MKFGRAAFAFIFITVLLDMLALGIIVPVLPKLVIAFEGGNTASAATMYGLFATVWATMQFLFAPLIGAISDRYGRRRVILISTLGLGLDYFVMAWAPTLNWLFVGRTISGITSASYATAFAYIADVTEPDKRAGKYGMLGAAFGVGFVLGPALGGLLGGIDLRLPFAVAGALSLLGTAYGYFILPESLPEERRTRFDWKKANPVGSLRFLRSHKTLFTLAATVFIYRVAHDAMPNIFVIYCDYRYGWSAETIGWVLAGIGVCTMIVQAGLIARIVGWVGERRAMLLGLATGIVAQLVFGAAPTGKLFLIGVPISAFFGLTYPSLQGILTRHVRPEEQGRLQGSIASLTGIAGVIAPILFTQTYALAVGPQQPLALAGAPFYLAAALLVVAAAVGARAAKASA